MSRSIMLAAAFTLSLAPLGLYAKPGNNNGNGNTHSNQENGSHGCPPGLARREPACVPPGLARQGITTEDRIGPMTTNYFVGDILDFNDFVTVTDLRMLGLPTLPMGEQYAVIDGTLVRLDADSYEILQLVRAATAVFQ